MSHFLAIDQSTSATKAVLFDIAGHVMDRAVRQHRQIYPEPGWVEHDAEEIWQNVLHVLRKIASRHANRLADAASLSITNQRETIVIFERRTGRPLCNAIVWQCGRADEVCDELLARGVESTVHAHTGLKLNAYFSAPKLKWLIDRDETIREKLQHGGALVGTIDTYLIYRLTGGEVFATDHTNASRTMLFDIDRLCWDEELCAVFNVPMRSLPRVRESFSKYGETDADGILPRRLPICGVMGDSQASMFAQRCYQPGMAKATFGSGTSVLLNAGARIKPTDDGTVRALAWVRDGQPTYALEGIIKYSSATISWLKDQLELIEDPGETERLARSVEDNGGVYFVPAFQGLSAPYWSQEARAAIIGITAHTGRGHVARAALEAIAYQIRDVLELLQRVADLSLKVLHVDGGPTENEFLMQFTADITRIGLAVAHGGETSARGAAMAGMCGLGIANSLAKLADMPSETRRYEPRMPTDEASKLYCGWQAAVKRVL